MQLEKLDSRDFFKTWREEGRKQLVERLECKPDEINWVCNWQQKTDLMSVESVECWTLYQPEKTILYMIEIFDDGNGFAVFRSSHIQNDYF